MAQQDATRFRPARLFLLGAGVIALAAVGWSIAARQDRREDTPVADAPATDPAATAQANPNDPAAWRALGSALYDQGRFTEAADAYSRAARLAPDVAIVWSAMGEALVLASKRDPLPAEARAAFAKAIALDPKDPRARYFLAVQKDLDGDHKGAIDDWLALLADTPADAPWRADVVRTIEQVGKINKIDTAARLATAQAAAPAASPAMPLAARGIPGPSAADLATASAMRPSDQRAMAEGMVMRLEGKLKADPANVDGWVMLMRSRVTLGEPGKARQALADAVAANPARAAYLREQAGVLGID
ncbi:tetratricopeptide repeat protein [Novosphingobium colocasiae]|uniref:tetratricopeptide repeat protein n=1 Tax=Novosphingobium colocasiae TaxID=1256513 RepID=UPI0035B13CF7